MDKTKKRSKVILGVSITTLVAIIGASSVAMMSYAKTEQNRLQQMKLEEQNRIASSMYARVREDSVPEVKPEQQVMPVAENAGETAQMNTPISMPETGYEPVITQDPAVLDVHMLYVDESLLSPVDTSQPIAQLQEPVVKSVSAEQQIAEEKLSDTAQAQDVALMQADVTENEISNDMMEINEEENEGDMIVSQTIEYTDNSVQEEDMVEIEHADMENIDDSSALFDNAEMWNTDGDMEMPAQEEIDIPAIAVEASETVEASEYNIDTIGDVDYSEYLDYSEYTDEEVITVSEDDQNPFEQFAQYEGEEIDIPADVPSGADPIFYDASEWTDNDIAEEVATDDTDETAYVDETYVIEDNTEETGINTQGLSPASTTASGVRKEIVDFANSRVGVTPYVWAGRSLETGTDCSGFVNLVYHNFGYYASAGSDDYQEVEGDWGENIGYEELQPGDVVVYRNGGHVGIYAGQDEEGNDLVVHDSNEIDGVKVSDMNYSTPTAFVRIIDDDTIEE